MVLTWSAVSWAAGEGERQETRRDTRDERTETQRRTEPTLAPDIVGTPVTMIVGDLWCRYLYQLDHGNDATSGAAANSGAEDEEEEEEDATSDGWLSILINLANTASLATIMFVYPTVVLPYFRAETTTDWERFIIVCFLHPLVQEFIMTGQRQLKSQKHRAVNDPDKEHLALQCLSTASCELRGSKEGRRERGGGGEREEGVERRKSKREGRKEERKEGRGNRQPTHAPTPPHPTPTPIPYAPPQTHPSPRGDNDHPATLHARDDAQPRGCNRDPHHHSA